ncbi:MAG TPA: DUF2171 domain-containing protein [Allosphingosinicella sp.]|jgi:hypothetical protein
MMGYDDRYGSDRERGRDGGRDSGRDHREGSGGGRGWNEGRREATGWGPGGHEGGHRGAGGHDGRGGGGDEDRGFFERASEAARSWFGGGDHPDGRGYERSSRDNGYGDAGGSGALGGGGFGGGWGNQEAESWNRDRPGRPGWFTDSVGGERGHRQGAGDDSHYGARPPRDRFSHDYSREQRSNGYGEQQHGGGRGSPAPTHVPMTGDYSRGGHSSYGGGGQSFQGGGGQSYQGGGGQQHDPHYSEWRRRQMEELDRDYDEYRREHQSKFENEFGGWRQKRQGQRRMVGTAREQMEVLGSDGAHIGTVDKVVGDRIILTRSDPNAGGVHHSVPCSWIENVADKVTLNRTAEQAMNEWRNEDRGRALFEKPGQGSDGPHVLNRSFSGTYRDDKETPREE